MMRRETGLVFKPSKAAIAVQIHTLQIPKKQGGSPMAQIRAVKTKPLTKEQVKEKWKNHGYKDLKEIALEILKEVPQEQLVPKLRILQQSTKPVVMGNLSVIDDNPMSRDSLTKSTIARICTASTANLAQGKQIAKGYAKLAAEVKEHKEREIDEELAQKAQNSQRIKWDHQTVAQQHTELKKLVQKDPELGLQKLKAYKLEYQEVAQKEG